jgi:hypothetical protein
MTQIVENEATDKSIINEYLKKSRRITPHHGKTSLGASVLIKGAIYCGDKKVLMRAIACSKVKEPLNTNQPTNATTRKEAKFIGSFLKARIK